jgi:hypothetical protein
MECGGKGSCEVVKLQPPGRPRAVTPQLTRPPRSIKSNAIMPIFKMNVCTIMNIKNGVFLYAEVEGYNNEFWKSSMGGSTDFHRRICDGAGNWNI